MKTLGKKEYITLMAMLSSLGALSIDCMLPALDIMGKDLNASSANDTQFIITSIFLGMMFGQFFYGPLSDSFGRKKILYIGLFIFLIGNIFSIFTNDLSVMLFARFLQGLGVSSTRVITTAMIRDQYKGQQMANIVSLVMMVFVIVPALAPLLGQLILSYFNWHAIFYLFIILGFISLCWFSLRMPETLAVEKRLPFNATVIKEKLQEVLKNKVAMRYTMASGICFGAFIGYLSSTAQIFSDIFRQKENFPYFFGLLALSIGFAAFINSKLVLKIGMKPLVTKSLILTALSSFTYLGCILFFNFESNLFLFMTYMVFLFFNIGILFGNFNSMAIEPLGHIAGMASAVISSLQSFISILLGTIIGQLYDGTTTPLVTSFGVLSLISIFIIRSKEERN